MPISSVKLGVSWALAIVLLGAHSEGYDHQRWNHHENHWRHGRKPRRLREEPGSFWRQVAYTQSAYLGKEEKAYTHSAYVDNASPGENKAYTMSAYLWSYLPADPSNPFLKTQRRYSKSGSNVDKNAPEESVFDIGRPFQSQLNFLDENFGDSGVLWGEITSDPNSLNNSKKEKGSLVIPSKNNLTEPVVAASTARERVTHNHIGHSRWTLKYRGMGEELNNTRVNITASLGGGTFLPCRIGHLGDRQISWIRRRDWHVLTSGRNLYTHDKRFAVLHEPGSQDWTLHIKWVSKKDSGTYECQVSTGTGIISLFVKLSVVIPEACIPGDGQYHVDKGSSISLVCYIRNSPTPPHYILWHHNGHLLNFQRDRQDVHIADDLHSRKSQSWTFNLPFSDKLTESTKEEENVYLSRLEVADANDGHSGNYTCSAAPNAVPDSTLIFIVEGDKTAAVQRIDSGASFWEGSIGTAASFLLFFLR